MFRYGTGPLSVRELAASLLISLMTEVISGESFNYVHKQILIKEI